MNNTFFDANILVYSLDEKNKEKQNIARTILQDAKNNNTAVISTQVLQEVYNIATKKLKMDKLVVKNILYNYRGMEIVQRDAAIIHFSPNPCIPYAISRELALDKPQNLYYTKYNEYKARPCALS
jgi:predicted nucleic acid-binding protein